MPDADTVIAEVRRVLRSEVRLAHRLPHLTMSFDEGTLKLAGEVPDVETKKLVLERAASVTAVEWISDRLTVTPADDMRDGEIRERLRARLLDEPTLRDCVLREKRGDALSVLHDPPEARGFIDCEIVDGVVTLDGEVPSLSHVRLAGVLAWWVPGVRDVRNWLGPEPFEEDNDDEISDAVRIVLAKDPFIDASQIRVETSQARVTLHGAVGSEAERLMAVHDAWYVRGVDDVCDDLVVSR